MLVLNVLALLAGANVALAKCKCTPLDPCWPSTSTWSSLNDTVDGRLVKNEPLAKPCYPGTGYDLDLCQQISKNLTDEVWLGTIPIGYIYPDGLSSEACPALNVTVAQYPICQLGSAPAYSIKATNADDVAAGIKFAQDNNVRLVVKMTGHDLEHRSQGYGSLSIWIRSIQNGLEWQSKFSSAVESCSSDYTGAAVKINGGYVWSDVYKFAGQHGHHVVGGADRTVGSLGGYLQGGGHGLLSHYYGLGTDQVLEYEVVLASGKTVIANACQNTDLFAALRGGGGGTFGVVISATVKAFPDKPVLLHNLAIAALSTGSWDDNVNSLYEVTSKILAELPGLSDDGWAGTAWFSVGKGLAFYQHPFVALLDDNSTSTVNKAKQAMEDRILSLLGKYNGTTLGATSKYTQYNSFYDYLFLPPFTPLAAGGKSAMASWLFERKAVESKSITEKTALLKTMTGGNQDLSLYAPGGGGGTALFNIVAGGKVLGEKNHLHTTVSPAWRKAHILMQQIDTWPKNEDPVFIQEKIHNLTYIKLDAMKKFSPGMGTYSNEADPWDPDWKESWWGDNYEFLLEVKEKYDPERVFWTWKSVGNEGWEEVKGVGAYGPVCETGKASK